MSIDAHLIRQAKVRTVINMFVAALILGWIAHAGLLGG